MDIEAALYQYLSNHSEVSDFFNEIEFLTLPENPDYPALTIKKISNYQNLVFAHPRFQLDVYSDKQGGSGYGEIKEGAGIIKSALYRFKGVMGDRPVKYINLLNEQDIYEEDVKLYREIIDFQIHYEE